MSDAYIMPDGGPDKKQLQEVLVPSASTVTLNTALITLAFCVTIVARSLYVDYKIHVSFVFLEITTVLEHSGHLIHFSVSLKMKHLPALNRLLSVPYREAQLLPINAPLTGFLAPGSFLAPSGFKFKSSAHSLT